MIVDFEKIPEAHLEGFKGGKGPLEMRSYSDSHIKIMYHTLLPGSSSGLHTHEGNCEVVFVISGTLTCHYDGEVEVCHAGECHYCPVGHSHYIENLTDHNCVYLAIVPEHHS